jgi:hypothetical protein
MQFAEGVKFNLVRADYLNPTLLRPFAYFAAKKNRRDAASRHAAASDEAEGGLEPPEPGDAYLMTPQPRTLSQRPARTGAGGDFLGELSDKIGKEFRDIGKFREMYHRFPARMRRFRLAAFVLGVLPEIFTLTMITVAGVQVSSPRANAAAAAGLQPLPLRLLSCSHSL